MSFLPCYCDQTNFLGIDLMSGWKVRLPIVHKADFLIAAD
jgi:hypothetical protein